MNKKLWVVSLALCFVSLSARAETPFSSYLDTEAIGAAAWKKAHPRWDGSGIAIAVLDTGVDMGVPGLEKGPDDGVKVVEARDFTGEAVVECARARFETGDDGRDVWRVKNGWVSGIGLPDDIPSDHEVLVGFLEESHFVNAGVSDLNGNGRKDDRFGVVLTREADGEWAARIDRDGDGNLSGEPFVRSYGKHHEPLRLKGHDPGRGVAPVAMAIEILADGDGPGKVEFHIPTGSHGTHVAGIAAGYRLNGKPGFDGVAPGARVLSLKIGDNRLSGGSTVTESMKKALEFAARWGRDHDVPVVVNMSYGVGSELEGQADIEGFVDGFAEENPHVVLVFSAGNSGPGLSTVGSPAAALHALAVAAAYTPGNSRDLLGASDTSEKLFHFSARGGELAKPDVAAPGIASSTVPYWERSDLFRGTSMAAPQVAGAAALILSSVRDRAVAWNSGMLKRSIVESARPVKGYGRLDVGGGMVAVGKARKAFLALAGERGAHHVMDIEISTRVPTSPGGKGRAVYWRAGGWVPDSAHPVKVKLKARFSSQASGKSKADYHRSFSLSSSRRWVKLSKGSVYLKGERESSFNLWIDPSAVKAPGVHVAEVTGKSGRQRFTFPVTVVTPFSPRAVDGVPTVSVHGFTMQPSEVHRFPLTVPPGASTAQVSVATTRRKKAALYVYLYDQQGRKVPIRRAMVASEEGRKSTFQITTADFLEPGTFELVLYSVPTARYASTVDLDVRYFSLDAPAVRSLSRDAGRPPRAGVAVTNRMAVPFTGEARGVIRGYETVLKKKVSGDSMTEGFHMSKEVEKVEFEITLSPEDYARFTDIAVNVLDSKGKALVRGGFTSRVARLVFPNPSPDKGEGHYRLEIRGGRALAGGPAFQVRLASRYILWDKPSLVGTVDGQQRFSLYPSVRSRVEFKASKTPKAPPSGASWYGVIDFVNARDGLTWLRVPVSARP